MIDGNLLIPQRVVYNLLGSICNEPKLMNRDGVKLEKEDFGSDFLKILFVSINNIFIESPTVNEITAVDIDNYLSQKVKYYKIFEANNGFEMIQSAKDNCNKELFRNNYNILKKFTLLRDLNNEGFSVKNIYNPTNHNLKEINEQAKALEGMSKEDVLAKVNTKLVEIKTKHNVEGKHKKYGVSDGIDDLLDRLNEKPDYGKGFLNSYWNSIFRGMRFGKLMIKSASTGVGKTRCALADIAAVSATEIWDIKNRCWRKQGQVYQSTFISTEIELAQLQTCLLAIITGVNERVIKDGKYSTDVLQRLQDGIRIIKESPIRLHYINDFSIDDIENIIEQDVLEVNSKFIFFDYLQITPKLSRTLQEEFKTGLREDQMMWNFSNRLKNIAELNNIYISTATQLNRNTNDREMRDSSCIRGGKQ